MLEATSLELKTIHVLPFNDKHDKWHMWLRKFLARGIKRSYKNVLLKKKQVPVHNKSIDPAMEDGKKVLLSRAANNQVYTDLILSCMDDVSFGAVDEATTDELPNGDVELA